MARRAPWFALVACGACAPDRFDLDPPWATEETALVVITDADDAPLVDHPIHLGPGTPLTLEVETSAELRVYAHVFSDVRAPAPAGLHFGGSGDLLRPDRLFVAELSDQAGGFQEASAPDRFDIRGPEAPVEVRACQGIERERFVFPELQVLTDVAIIDGEVFVGAGDRGRVHAELHHLEGNTLGLLHRFEPYSGWIVGLEWDGRSIWAATAGGDVAAFDEAGGLRFEGRTMARREGLSIGRDGTILSWGWGSILEHSETASLGIVRSDIVPANTLRGIEVRSAEEIIVYDEIAVYTWSRGSFVQELEEVRAELTDVQSDAERTLVISRNLGTFLRGPAGPWEKLGWAHTGFPERGVLLPRGFMVAGERGASALRIDGVWCGMEPPILEEIARLAATPDGRTIYGVGSVVEGGLPVGVLYRLSIPPSP